jgi:sec-independent protein translocase protein TatA
MNTLAFFTNLFTGGDGIIILVIVLIIFGPKKLPELARGMGQAIKEFHKAKDEIERELAKSPEVSVQPAPGQQPRQPAELPAIPPTAYVPPATYAQETVPAPNAVPQPVPQPMPAAEAHPVEETHPAGQA